MTRCLAIIGLMLIVVGIFELHPAVEYWRIVVPEDVYVGKECDCWCILQSRPWYSRFNYWFWFFVIAPPVIVFSVKPDASKWLRAAQNIVTVLVCYGTINLAVHLMWDIRNGPFGVVSEYPWQKSWDDPGTKCANIADGASIVFTALFGWIYGVIYTGWWEMIWYRYHRQKTKLIDENYKRDWFSTVIVFISYYITRLGLLVMISMPFAFAGLYALDKLGLVAWYKSFFI